MNAYYFEAQKKNSYSQLSARNQQGFTEVLHTSDWSHTVDNQAGATNSLHNQLVQVQFRKHHLLEDWTDHSLAGLEVVDHNLVGQQKVHHKFQKQDTLHLRQLDTHNQHWQQLVVQCNQVVLDMNHSLLWNKQRAAVHQADHNQKQVVHWADHNQDQQQMQVLGDYNHQQHVPNHKVDSFVALAHLMYTHMAAEGAHWNRMLVLKQELDKAFHQVD